MIIDLEELNTHSYYFFFFFVCLNHKLIRLIDLNKMVNLLKNLNSKIAAI